MTNRLKILLFALLGAVMVLGAVILIRSQQDQNDYHKGQLVKTPRKGLMDANKFWSSIRYRQDETQRAIGIAESFGTFIFWEHSEGIKYDDLLHTCRGNYSERDSKLVISGPFGADFVLASVTIDGVTCLVPDGMEIMDAFEQGWILVFRDGGDAASPFTSGKMTLLDQPDFRIDSASIERKKEAQQAAPFNR